MKTATHTIGPLRQEPPLPPDSDLPPIAPPTRVEDVVTRPEVAGGLDNIPEGLLPASEAADDELDHAGLDVVLPDEDAAPIRSAERAEDAKPAEKWGQL